MVLTRAVIETPLGLMVTLASEEALCALEFVSEHESSRLAAPRLRSTLESLESTVSPANGLRARAGSGPPRLPPSRGTGRGRLSRLKARLDRWFAPYSIEDGSNAVITCAHEWLEAYFSGAYSDLRTPLDMRGQTFERRVWQALRQIPPGVTSTYGALAKELGSPGASRAVGLANGANPIAIIVPCHRVIGSNGTLTGYGGGLDKKQWLLDHEQRWAGNTQLTLELTTEHVERQNVERST